MESEKDRFGDTMRLVERAKEDIYFGERDREVLQKLRNQLRKVETVGTPPRCPKLPRQTGGLHFRGFCARSLP